MSLSPEQLLAIKTDILANPDLSSQPANTDGDFEIARLYNLPASPDFWVWKTKLLKHDATDSTSPDATTFSWPAYISRSQGERDGWREIWNSTLSVNPSLANVRQAFADIFSGAAGAANRTHLNAMARRSASRIEKLLATGTGTTASPATMGYEGPISYREIQTARSS